MNSAVKLFRLLFQSVAFRARDLIAMPLKPSRAPRMMARKELVIAIIAMISAIEAMIGALKWFARWTESRCSALSPPPGLPERLERS